MQSIALHIQSEHLVVVNHSHHISLLFIPQHLIAFAGEVLDPDQLFIGCHEQVALSTGVDADALAATLVGVDVGQFIFTLVLHTHLLVHHVEVLYFVTHVHHD